MNPGMKLMAIDYGEKRVGIASTDESGQYALPREVVPNNADLLERVVKFAEENQIERVVMGESKDFSGKENPVMRGAHELKERLEEKGWDVVLHPELFSTMEARQLQGNTEMTDASAAAIVLKSYIERTRH